MPTPLYYSDLSSLPLLQRGKVRDVYSIDEEALLMVASDRLSAFDVIMRQAVPDKGKILNALSKVWMHRLAHIIDHHLLPEEVVADRLTAEERRQIAGHYSVVRRLTPLPIEAVVRGYLAGSGWQDYVKTGTVCGHSLPRGLRQSALLPTPIFTPAIKAATGDHDENIDSARAAQHLSDTLAPSCLQAFGGATQLIAQVAQVAIALYQEAAKFTQQRGIILADTKFEFGVDAQHKLYLMDEALTPDSSRFWPEDSYQIGTSPPSFDKQYVRDELLKYQWDKSPPPPELSEATITATRARYLEAWSRLTDQAPLPF